MSQEQAIQVAVVAIVGYGYVNGAATEATRRLYATFAQPFLNEALARTIDGRTVIKLAKQLGLG